MPELTESTECTACISPTLDTTSPWRLSLSDPFRVSATPFTLPSTLPAKCAQPGSATARKDVCWNPLQPHTIRNNVQDGIPLHQAEPIQRSGPVLVASLKRSSMQITLNKASHGAAIGLGVIPKAQMPTNLYKKIRSLYFPGLPTSSSETAGFRSFYALLPSYLHQQRLRLAFSCIIHTKSPRVSGHPPRL